MPLRRLGVAHAEAVIVLHRARVDARRLERRVRGSWAPGTQVEVRVEDVGRIVSRRSPNMSASMAASWLMMLAQSIEYWWIFIIASISGAGPQA